MGRGEDHPGQALFLSYRRQDAPDAADRLRDSLGVAFGVDAVFRDVDSIAVGDRWPHEIERAIGSARAVIALIGPRWLLAHDAYGRRRIDAADDWVRHELLSARKLDKRVYPLLVAGATMPPAAALPAELAWLGDIHAIALQGAWDDVVEVLCRQLEADLELVRTRPPPSQPVGAHGDNSASRSSLAEAEQRYLAYVDAECASIQNDGLAADHTMSHAPVPLERLFVPMHVHPIDLAHPTGVDAAAAVWSESADSADRVPVGLAVEDARRVAIVGPPGSGKTTLIKRFATAYAFPDRRSEIDDDLPARDWMPLLIRCRDLHRGVRGSIRGIVRHIAELAELGDAAEGFEVMAQRAVEDGRALLIVDGLDEVGDPGPRKTLVTQLNRFAVQHPDVAMIVTSREVGIRHVAGSLAKTFDAYRLAGFDASDIQRASMAWHSEVLGDRDKAATITRKLVASIRDREPLAELARTPLLLTTLFLVHRSLGRIPSSRSVLYDEATKILLSSWNIEAHDALEPVETVPQLAFVAWAMLRDREDRIGKHRLRELLIDAREQMPGLLSRTRLAVDEFIERVEARTSMIQVVGHDVESGRGSPLYEFRHKSFQEYLAAQAAVDGFYPGFEPGARAVDALAPYLDDGRWREVVPLAAVLDRRGSGLIEMLLERISATDRAASRRMLVGTLAQCLQDAIDLHPDLAQRAYRCIVEHSDELPEHSHRVAQGPFGDEFAAFVWEAFRVATHDLQCLGSAAAAAETGRRGWREVPGDDPAETLALAARSARSEVDSDRARVAMVLAGYLTALTTEGRGALELGDAANRDLRGAVSAGIEATQSDLAWEQYAGAWLIGAAAWLGQIDDALAVDAQRRLTEIGYRSGIDELRRLACWAFAGLPLVDPNTNGLPVPDEHALEWIREAAGDGDADAYERMTALTASFYWGQPFAGARLAYFVEKACKQIDTAQARDWGMRVQARIREGYAPGDYDTRDIPATHRISGAASGSDVDPMGSTIGHLQMSQQGSESAVQLLFAKIQTTLRRRFSSGDLPPSMELADLVGEVALAVHTNLTEFDADHDRDAFWSWIRVIAEHVIANAWRTRKARKRGWGREALEVEPDTLTPSDEGPDSAVELDVRGRELQERIEQAIALLPERYQEILRLRTRGLSYSEIAERMGYNRAVTVRSLYFRAARRLRAILRGMGYEA